MVLYFYDPLCAAVEESVSNMDTTEIRKRFAAARDLLDATSTSRAKFTAARNLIQGLNTNIDMTLAKCDEAISTLEKVQEGEVIELSAGHLPENTEDQKKRKAAILLLIKSWNQLQGEVKRVEAELSESVEAPQGEASHVFNILSAAKGPLGVITILAIGAVMLKTSAVSITVYNVGCSSIQPVASLPVPIPGVDLPRAPLKTDESVVISIPSFPLTADGTKPGEIVLSSLGFSARINLTTEIRDVEFDGKSLIGTKTPLALSKTLSHELRVICR